MERHYSLEIVVAVVVVMVVVVVVVVISSDSSIVVHPGLRPVGTKDKLGRISLRGLYTSRQSSIALTRSWSGTRRWVIWGTGSAQGKGNR
jgi:hypothetical protein